MSWVQVEADALSQIVHRALRSDPALAGCALSDGARKALLASADGDAVLFSFSDRPVQEKLGLWREDRGNH